MKAHAWVFAILAAWLVLALAIKFGLPRLLGWWHRRTEPQPDAANSDTPPSPR